MRSNVITLALGAAGVVLLAACGGSTSPYGGGGGGGGGGGTCTPTASKVCMNALTFSPASLTVTAGTTVTWQNGSVNTHTVTSDAGSTQTYDSGSIGNAGTFSQTFNTAGTYNYHCKFHVASGMTGTITVNP
jgi:plastocyanin